MTRRIIDISMPLENDVISDPQPFSPKITYIDHEQSYAQMAPFFPGLKKGRPAGRRGLGRGNGAAHHP